MDVQQIMTQIGFDWRVALASLVNFLIIFWLLKRYAFKPLAKVIKDRQETIDDGLEQAQVAETERIMAEEKAKQTIATAKNEANTIMTSANDRKTAIISEAENAAGERASEILEKADRDVERKHEDMLTQLRTESAELVISSVEKVLREDLTAEKNADIVKRALAAMNS